MHTGNSPDYVWLGPQLDNCQKKLNQCALVEYRTHWLQRTFYSLDRSNLNKNILSTVEQSDVFWTRLTYFSILFRGEIPPIWEVFFAVLNQLLNFCGSLIPYIQAQKFIIVFQIEKLHFAHWPTPLLPNNHFGNVWPLRFLIVIIITM